MAGAKKKAGASKASSAAAASAAVVSSAPAAEININRNVTGVLTSHPQSRDIHIEQFSLSSYGVELISDTKLELNYGLRYGLLGKNGSGKSTMMEALGSRECPVPGHMDIFHLKNEVEATELTALQAVMEETERERTRLEALAETLMDTQGVDSPALQAIYERLDEMEADSAEHRAAMILHGLGFNGEMQAKRTKDFSGGWRMRIALAKALFVAPYILLLDEPTNHLDLEACVWLEDHLKNFKHILLLVSHSQDFLNGVCTNIIHIQHKKLVYYTGNYDQYVQTRAELEVAQTKQYNWEQDQLQHMKDYVARFGHGSAKLARQAQSKEKVMAKMIAGGLTERVVSEKTKGFEFPACEKLPPPVLQFVDVSFTYPGTTRRLFHHLELGVDSDSRIALVGPNGAGKSTLLKLMCGQLASTEGMVRAHTHLRIARFHQHLTDQLDLEMSALDFMRQLAPDTGEEHMRRVLGCFGLSGTMQLAPMKNLSDGQQFRVCFAMISWKNPNMLLLDEPTNHLDMETIDALAEAINSFQGGMVLVSHDFRLINQVAQEIWVAENETITKWKGDIQAYKQHLKTKVLKDVEEASRA